MVNSIRISRFHANCAPKTFVYMSQHKQTNPDLFSRKAVHYFSANCDSGVENAYGGYLSLDGTRIAVCIQAAEQALVSHHSEARRILTLSLVVG